MASEGVEPHETERAIKVMWCPKCGRWERGLPGRVCDHAVFKSALGYVDMVEVEYIPAEHLVAERARAERAESVLGALIDARALNTTRTHREYETELQKQRYSEAETFLNENLVESPDPLAAERARAREELRERVDARCGHDDVLLDRDDVLTLVDEVLGGDGDGR